MLSAINGGPDSEARGPVGGGASLEYQHGAKRAKHAVWTRAGWMCAEASSDGDPSDWTPRKTFQCLF